MTRTDDIAAARAADERIAAAWEAVHDADREHVGPLHDRLSRARNQRKFARGAEAIAAADLAVDERLAAVRAMYAEKVTPLRAVAAELDRELYTGWQRFFLVKHIHSSTECSSFRPSTEVGWLPKLSGLTEAEAVAAHGSILCTKCFPSAPVEWTDGRGATDDGTCPGSGQLFDPEQPNTARLYYGATATCPVCEQLVGLKSRGSSAVRKHARP